MKIKIRLIIIALLTLAISATAQNVKKEESSCVVVELKFFEYQIGKWEDDKVLKTPDGRKYKFVYELKWFDRKKTAAKMHITGVFEDGEVRTFWEGFKYWSISEKKMLYNGFSPDGRIAGGYLEIGEKIITTHYSSDTPNGKVYIKDVAEKIDNDHFTTTTHLKQGDADWRTVNRDSWTRISQEKTSEKLKILPEFQNLMVFVKGGTFKMGDEFGDGRDDEKLHEVRVDDFYLSQFEVSVADFRRFVEKTGYITVAEKEGTAQTYIYKSEDDRGWKETKNVNWREPGFPQTDNHPVVAIAWEDARAFTKWLTRIAGKSYRLPTESEWEYAAKNGGKKTKYPWGNNEPSGKEANFADLNTKYPWSDKNAGDGFIYTAPVGSFPANDLGIYDLAGNVWEWLEDIYVSKESSKSTPIENRVMRSGSWINRSNTMRASARNYDDPKKRFNNLGFRLAMSK